MNSGPPGPMPGQKDDRIRKGELFDEQRKKEEEDGGVDFEAIFARIAKLEEMSARNSTDRMKLEKRTNYLGKVVEDLHMEAKEEENCVRMTSRTANFGSTDIRVGNLLTCFRMHSRSSRSRLPSASSSPSSMSLLLGYQVPL